MTITGLPRGLSAHPAIVGIELLLFAYFLFSNTVDFALIIGALRHLPQLMRMRDADRQRAAAIIYAPPVSILLPAYNEEAHIVSVVRSLLAVRYPQFELIIVNDGSTDATMRVLTEAFSLVPLPEARYVGLKTKPVREVYRSTEFPNLRVLDKENGGKGDALNAGINESRYPLLFAADGDSLYSDTLLEEMIVPFMQDPSTVGCGAAIRIVNQRRNFIVRVQIIEYLRAALNSRFGWRLFNGIMCISGACALWKKEVLLAAGGYSVDTIWEDAEMTVRVHHYMRAQGRRYRVAFVPTAVCFTHVPETLNELAQQRMSWQRHISEAVSRHRRLLFARRGGMVGWLALPAYALFEWLAPVWLLVGAGFVIAAGELGILSWQAQLALLASTFALTALKSALALLLDQLSYRTVTMREIPALFFVALIEPIGYRQLHAVWNLAGILQFCFKRPIRGRRTGIAGPFDAPYRPKVSARIAS
jgi:cellulose synthase/poly-beta-1,6-N-acetylglucosamine synthase-like glycosyltransferase